MEQIKAENSVTAKQTASDIPSASITWHKREPQAEKKSKQRLRAVIYARVRTQEQAQKRTSVPDQLEICRKVITEKDWMFVQEYMDDGVSGHLTLERHGLQSMLRDAREHRFDLIVVKDYDRFARNKDSAAIIRQELKELGIQTFSVNTPVDPRLPRDYDPDDDDLGTIVEAISDMRSDLERKQIVRRMKTGRLLKAKLGSIPNRVPYGYRIVRELDGTKIKRIIFVSEEEASRVRFIFNAYAHGSGDRKIAIQLNRKGWKSPQGTRWTIATIRYILANPTYTGKVWWGWRHADYKKTKELRRREKMGYVGPGSHQAIIDENLFKLVQEARSGRAKAGRGGSERSFGLLTGLAKCIRCGSGVGYRKRYHSRSKQNLNWNDTVTFEYVCTGYTHKGICSFRVMSAEKLESAVLDQVKNIYAHPKVQERIVYDRKPEEEQESETEIARLGREIESEISKIDRQTVAYERGIISVEEYKANIERIREETRQNRMDQDRLLTLSSQSSQHSLAIQKLLASLRDFDTLWNEMELDERKLILRSIIKEIRAGEGRTEIDFIF